ncbi:hypothetical protein [Burkholderia thailandensis]|uniref:hypothetical protein n=1 Tax=Burkholderia thailandensis TaxID=57975 RepID=UPI00016A79EE|nr:hypothetical protein [Burkholderia thailandensis]AOJ44432.1 nucleotide-binding protein [Burkholderia thailandensis]AVR09846.1 nucleotide-binding protein [Burkholderia thailandensis]AWY57429.1 nucleotide-binding protein [Burkholderia thailandensis]AWY68415.1 nucleotide-binding protein [Burkholderia thailandensis]KVG10268.1 nucleotide-binding protein [Burkholderia thailandensis]
MIRALVRDTRMSRLHRVPGVWRVGRGVIERRGRFCPDAVRFGFRAPIACASGWRRIGASGVWDVRDDAKGTRRAGTCAAVAAQSRERREPAAES